MDIAYKNKIRNLILILGAILLPFVCLRFGTEFIDYFYMKATGDWMLEHGIMYKHPFFIDECTTVIQQWAYCIYISLISKLGKWGVLLSESFFAFLYYLTLRLFLKEYNIGKARTVVYFYVSIVVSLFYLVKIRPETITIIFLFLEIYALERFRKTDNWKFLLLLPLTMLLEINFHGTMWPFHYVVILPFITPFYPDLVKNENYSLNQIKRLLPFVLAMTIAMFMNPYGLDMIMYLPNTYLSKAFKYVGITEIVPASYMSFEGAILLFIIVVFVIFLIKIKMSSISFYFILGFWVVSIPSCRNFMFLPIAMTFLLIEAYRNLNFDFSKIPLDDTDRKYVTFLIAAGILIFTLPLSTGVYSFVNNTWMQYSDSKVFDVLEENTEKNDKIFSFFEDTSYLEGLGYTNVYIDSRPEMYMKRINKKDNYLKEFYDVVENKDTFNNGENIKAFIEKYDFKYYLLKTASPYMRTIIITLQNNDNYKLIYSDDKYILFERNGTNNINAMPQRG